MKVILSLLILIICNRVYTRLNNNNFNHNRTNNLLNYSRTYNNKENIYLRKRRSVYYRSYEYPYGENHLTTSNSAISSLNLNQKSLDKSGCQTVRLTANEHPFIQHRYTNTQYNYKNYNFENRNEINNPHTAHYTRIEIRPPHNVQPQARSLTRSDPHHFANNNKVANGDFSNSRNHVIDVGVNTDDVNASLENYDNAEYKQPNNFPHQISSHQPCEETFQYQYNRDWSSHEAVRVDDIVIPQLEEHKYSKHSTPNAPEAHYYQKFSNIYNLVEHQSKKDLGQYEKESINDDFNGRSIVAPGQYPHMAAIGFLSNEEKIEFKCGGSLISKMFVITAAHCCYLNGETPIIVKLGIINLKPQLEKSDPQRRAIQEIIVHPNYNSTMNYNDIALLKLQTPVEFTKYVRPILLWSSNDIPYERVFTMGYGSTSFAKSPTNILTELSLSLIPFQTCKEIMPYDEKAPNGIVESQICGRDLERNRDTCQGDSGGPLQLNLQHRKQRNTYRYYLVGIISYGDFCGNKKPGIYTRVSSYCKWIASMVWPSFDM